MRRGEGKEIRKPFTDFPKIMQLAACSQEHVEEKIDEKDTYCVTFGNILEND